MAAPTSIKHLQIDKANRSLVLITATCAVIFTFSLVASRALLSQRGYQGRVIKEKTIAAKQLKANVAAVESLDEAYKAFVGTQENVIGGSVSGQGDRDGDNAKIVLDALPSRYDFPALTASLEKLLSEGGHRINSITGTDDELNQSALASSGQPIEIPFQVSITGGYETTLTLFDVLDRSIRPFQVTTISMSGTTNSLTMVVSAKTYYQPEKTLGITTKDVQ